MGKEMQSVILYVALTQLVILYNHVFLQRSLKHRAPNCGSRLRSRTVQWTP